MCARRPRIHATPAKPTITLHNQLVVRWIRSFSFLLSFSAYFSIYASIYPKHSLNAQQQQQRSKNNIQFIKKNVQMLPFKLNDSSFLYDFYCSLWISDHFALIMCVSSLHTIVKWSSSYIAFLPSSFVAARFCLFVCECERLFISNRDASNEFCYVQTDRPTHLPCVLLPSSSNSLSVHFVPLLLLDTVKVCDGRGLQGTLLTRVYSRKVRFWCFFFQALSFYFI